MCIFLSGWVESHSVKGPLRYVPPPRFLLDFAHDSESSLWAPAKVPISVNMHIRNSRILKWFSVSGIMNTFAHEIRVTITNHDKLKEWENWSNPQPVSRWMTPVLYFAQNSRISKTCPLFADTYASGDSYLYFLFICEVTVEHKGIHISKLCAQSLLLPAK